MHRLLFCAALLGACDPEVTDPGDDDWSTWTETDEPDGEACATAVPSFAMVIHATETLNTDPGHAWICDGGSATVNAGGTFYVESGGAITANSGAMVIYADDSSQVTINAGADVELYRTPAAAVTTYATDLDETACSSLDLDVSDAPAGGCG